MKTGLALRQAQGKGGEKFEFKEKRRKKNFSSFDGGFSYQCYLSWFWRHWE